MYIKYKVFFLRLGHDMTLLCLDVITKFQTHFQNDPYMVSAYRRITLWLGFRCLNITIRTKLMGTKWQSSPETRNLIRQRWSEASGLCFIFP